MSAAASVLFDAPGPRARNLYRVIGAVALLVLLGLLYLVYRGFAKPDNNQFTAEKWAPFADPVTWTAYFIPGILATLKAAGLAVVFAIVLGLLLGMGRLSALTPLRAVCGVLVEFFRSVPVLVMMLFFYYFGQYALGIQGDAASFFGVVAGLTFYNASVIAELVRSGVGSLPKGQGEAGLAIGMTPSQTLVSILLPQAIALMLPSIISQLVVILKDTALGYIIAYSELIRAGQNLSSFKGNLIPTLVVVAALFIVLNYALTRIARLVEKRLSSSRRGPQQPPADPMLNPAMAPGASTAAGSGPA
jgi:glutamate transport system permease protein